MHALIVLAVLSCLLLCSCGRQQLYVRSEYFTKKDLASVVIDTPDPRKDMPYFGQRIAVEWNLPATVIRNNDCELKIYYRLLDGTERTKELKLEQRLGKYELLITGDDYTVSGGLLSYLVTITQNGHIIAESRHKFWVNPIIISE